MGNNIFGGAKHKSKSDGEKVPSITVISEKYSGKNYSDEDNEKQTDEDLNTSFKKEKSPRNLTKGAPWSSELPQDEESGGKTDTPICSAQNCTPDETGNCDFSYKETLKRSSTTEKFVENVDQSEKTHKTKEEALITKTIEICNSDVKEIIKDPVISHETEKLQDEKGDALLSPKEEILIGKTEDSDISNESIPHQETGNQEASCYDENIEEQESTILGTGTNGISENLSTEIINIESYLENIDTGKLNIESIEYIQLIKKKAQTYEEAVKNYKGTNYSIEYYALDENLTQFIEHLDQLRCRQNKELLKEKIDTINYIKKLQHELDDNANET